MPNKLTDAEVKKALERCSSNDEQQCWYCPYIHNPNGCLMLPQDALDLINRQEQENENLKAEVERLKGCVKTEDEVKEIAKRAMEPLVIEITREQIDIAVKLAKAEAYKEFAERLNEIATQGFWEAYAYVGTDQINNLLKELVGDSLKFFEKGGVTQNETNFNEK